MINAQLTQSFHVSLVCLSRRLSNELSKLQREMMTTKQQFVVASARQQASEAEHKNAVQVILTERRSHSN